MAEFKQDKPTVRTRDDEKVGIRAVRQIKRPLDHTRFEPFYSMSVNFEFLLPEYLGTE